MRTAKLLLIATTCVLLVSTATQGLAAKKSWSIKTKVAPGVWHTNMRDASGPFRMHILSIKLSKPSTLDTVLATDVLPGRETTSSMAARSNAIAAVNGSYSHESGRPVYAFARDGYLDQTPFSWGRNFAPISGEAGAYFGHPEVTTWLTDDATGAVHTIERVNAGPPLDDELALFTPSGAWEERPPQFACSARLIPIETPKVFPEPGVGAIHVVDEVVCRKWRLGRQGGVVVSTPMLGARAPEISTLVPGQQLTLGWSPTWLGVKDMVGGNPTLIEDGLIQWQSVIGNTAFHNRNPRTGIGLTPDGRVLLVTVDGRQPGYSVGMTLRKFATFFKSLGAQWAINMDGGGSSTFVLKGRIRNRPSDGPERAVSSSVVLLPGPDPGEPIQPPPPPEVVAGSENAAVWLDVVSDPGSTGGLADFLQRSGRSLSGDLKEAARRFARR
jgi:Phosphodiester glycosidase